MKSNKKRSLSHVRKPGRSSSVIRRKAKKNKEIPILKNQRVIPDAEIMPKKMLNKRLRTRPANVSLSAKKRNKMLKQIRRELNEKSKMEVCNTKTDKTMKPTSTDVEMLDKS